MIPTRQ